MTRLDIFVSDKEKISRSKSKDFILRNRVVVNGKFVTKPSFIVDKDDDIKVLQLNDSFVSRAGEKLDYALDYFNIDVSGMKALDVGASTGGFSECLLRRGVSEIDAVDVGKNQLHEKVKSDLRVNIYEQTDIREFKKGKDYSIITVDVSFISVEHIAESLKNNAKEGTLLIILIKPQFEVGNFNIGKSGVVKDKKLHDMAIDKVVKILAFQGFKFCDIIESPILGKSGNKEFLAYFKFFLEEKC